MANVILSVADVCAKLGIKARKLKIAIYVGVLPPADQPHVERSLSGFTQSWVDKAKPIVATKGFKAL